MVVWLVSQRLSYLHHLYNTGPACIFRLALSHLSDLLIHEITIYSYNY